jgi:hypothetical protein
MDASSQTTSTTVLDGLAEPYSLPVEPCHPTERALSRFAANEMGTQRKRSMVQHLETCQDCQRTVTRLHEIARRYRDLERRAIAHVATQIER